MKKHLKIFICYFRLNFASALEYRESFLTQAFGMALSNSSFIFFWWIAFSQIGENIAGYSFNDVLFLWATASAGYGLSLIFFANISRLTSLIVNGELDVFLLQPCNILVNLMSAGTNFSAYGDLLYGLVIMCIVYMKNAAAWLWFGYGAIVFCLLYAAIRLISHTLSFFLGDATIIGRLTTEFAVNFSIYPEKIYAPAVRSLMYSLIPVGIAIHIPLRQMGGFSFGLTAVSLCIAILYCVFAGWFFYRGLKRYESGNMIVIRL